MERNRLGFMLTAVATACCLLTTGVGAVSRSYDEALSEILALSRLGLLNTVETEVPVEPSVREFPCPQLPPSSSPPTSVHRLRPTDIKVGAALGDSLTAGFGMAGTNVFSLLREQRQSSFSIGGGESFETIITMPNIARAVGALSLVGLSTNSTVWNQTPLDRDATGFNMAITGSTAQDLLQQAELLTNLMLNDTRVDFQGDWKLITIFIGGNDLCDSCKRKGGHSKDDYVGNITAAIDHLKDHIPRVFVNLVQVMRVSPLRNVTKPDSKLCFLNKVFCSCVINANPSALERLEELNTDYQRGLEELLGSGRYDNNDSFTVVLQPCIRDTQPPTLPDGNVDGSFFALDCFHFTTKGHETLATMLWNNMLEPEGAKSVLDTLIHPPPPILCPSEDSPFLYTRQNSGAVAVATTARTTAVRPTAAQPTTAKSSTTSLHTTGLCASLLLFPLVGLLRW